MNCLFKLDIIITANGKYQTSRGIPTVSIVSLGLDGNDIHATYKIWPIAKCIESLVRLRTESLFPEACGLQFKQIEQFLSSPSWLL